MSDNTKTSKKKIKKDLSESQVTMLSSLVAIVAGLLVGFLFLIIIEVIKENSNLVAPFTGFTSLITAGFSSLTRITKVFYNAAPLLMCGLAVGFAFKAGLFNIGATGQYLVGGFLAIISALVWQMPWWISMLVALLGGALWGLIPGIFKAFFNINEVITTIMLNWSALFFVNLLFYNVDGVYLTEERTIAITNTPTITRLIPDLGLGEISSYINVGILVAILFAVLIYILLEKTTFGFEIKAVGQNKNASEYAGIKSKRTIILTMLIAGGLAGIGGGITYLSGTVEYTVSSTTLPAMGFNGIPVALLAFSNPLGIIASSIFISYLQVGGEAMQPVYSVEMVNVITSVIIYFSAFALIISQVIRKVIKNRKNDLDQQQENVEADIEVVDKPIDQSTEEEASK